MTLATQVTCVFPGQGAQHVGMGESLVRDYDEAKHVFAEADDALGESISSVCFQGPADTLQLTMWAQPALLVASVAAYRVVERHTDALPVALAGHSLGEWSALVAAGAIPLSDAVRAVRARGRFMQESVPVGVGGMAAVMGLSADVVSELCGGVADGDILAPANLNGSTQTVVAGHVQAIDRLIDAARESGGKAKRLPVSAPFHCSLMQPAADRLAEVIASLPVERPTVPVVSTVRPEVLTEPARIRELLHEQVVAPVRWTEATVLLLACCRTAVLECGPGKTLLGLLKRIDAGVPGLPAGDAGDIAALTGALA